MSFNLLDEEWIPILRTNGRFKRVGIREALTNAGNIRQIAASNPMDNVALLRLLLAVLYWCKQNPPNDENAISNDPFPVDWFSKLDANKDCFNLLGDGKRFYQCAASGSAKPPDKLTANYLIHEIPTGTNKWHFRHSTDKVNGLCPACCTMGLLRLPLFATSGGRTKPPGINAKPPVYVIPIGVSLAATLRLSWRQTANLGTPAWVEPDLQLPKAGQVPLLVGLTWLPRRVWLDSPEEPEATCISCGRRERVIRLCVFAGIGSTRTDSGAPGRIWRDPHVLYTTSAKGDVFSLHASDALGAFDAAAGHWAKLVAGTLRKQEASDALGLATHDSGAESAKVHAWVVGFSTVQNDKYLETMESLIPLSASTSIPQLQESIAKIERWQKEGSSLVRKVKRKVEQSGEKVRSRKHVEIPPMIAAIRPHVEHRVSAKTGGLIAGTDEAWNQAVAEYRPMMETIAKSLSPGFTTAALLRRKGIATVLPNVQPKSQAVKNLAKKKGKQ